MQFLLKHAVTDIFCEAMSMCSNISNYVYCLIALIIHPREAIIYLIGIHFTQNQIVILIQKQ